MSELQPRSFRYLEEEGIGTITLNRPDRLNALTFEVYAELRDFFVTLADRGSLKVVIITGEGRGFCSGGDVDAIIGALLKQGMTELLTFTRMTGALIANIRAPQTPVIPAPTGPARRPGDRARRGRAGRGRRRHCAGVRLSPCRPPGKPRVSVHEGGSRRRRH